MKNIWIIIAICFVASCTGKSNFDVDVSNIDADINVVRFHDDFNNIKEQNIYQLLDSFNVKYGDFFELYTRDILGLPKPESADYSMKLSDFMNYCRLNSIFTDVDKEFPQNEALSPLLQEGAKHYKYYFHNSNLPTLYTIVSGFQESIFPSENLIAVSLEKYLGVNYPSYQELGIDNYKRKRMCKERIAIDYFQTYAMLNYPKSDSCADDLLNEMIYKGKIQYFLKSMFPTAPDSLLWGYSNVQYLWVEAYEENVWNYLIDKKLLFKTEPLLIRNLTGEGPFTNAFGNQSAPGAASFCGFRIVCSFMKNNPEITLPELMKINDLQSIYNKSRYNP